jgi:(p)ppGpp synthase/HD superfamily hydrolase
MAIGRQFVWQRAASFAARAHRGQLRDDGVTPYVAHPLRVGMIVRQVFGCEDEVAIAAAFLHDTIEDTPTDYDEIEEGFGREVADCVAALTKNMLLPYERREADYDERLRGADWRARLVKLADVYDNLSESLDAMVGGIVNGQGQPSAQATVKKLRPRVERAIVLSQGDLHRPEIKRAIEAVQGLLATA